MHSAIFYWMRLALAAATTAGCIVTLSGALADVGPGEVLPTAIFAGLGVGLLVLIGPMLAGLLLTALIIGLLVAGGIVLWLQNCLRAMRREKTNSAREAVY